MCPVLLPSWYTFSVTTNGKEWHVPDTRPEDGRGGARSFSYNSLPSSHYRPPSGSSMPEDLRQILWLRIGAHPAIVALVTVLVFTVLRRIFKLVKVAQVGFSALLPAWSSESRRIDHQLFPETIHPLPTVHFTGSIVRDLVLDRRGQLALGATFPK